MKFNPETYNYLSGKLFSAGIDISFADEKYPDQSRISKILELTKNKRVIHVGCADHLPLIEEKIKNKKWLHGLLLENTTECLGVDINDKAVNFITNKLKIKNVFCFNILENNPIFQSTEQWDFMVLGEIIEHIDNPVAFLKELKERYQGKVDKLIITAPNIYNLLTISDIKKNIENINTDHRYWFSPFTLSKILVQSNFSDSELFFVERVKLPFFRALIKRIKSLLGLPLLFNANCFSTLVLVANFRNNSN